MAGGRMMILIHFIKFIIKVLLFIVLLPFFLLWASIRYRIFSFALIKSLRNASMPKDYAKDLAKEMNITKLFNRKS